MDAQPATQPGRRGQVELEDFADLADAVAHEFNNLLNNIALEIAVLEHSGKASAAANELGTIRQVVAKAAGMVRRLQQLGHEPQFSSENVDLNEVVRAVTGRSPSLVPADRLELNLAETLPPVLGKVRTLERLVELLLENAAVATAPDRAALTLKTGSSSDHVWLRVEDGGTSVAGNELAHLFEPFASSRNAEEGWRLAVCKTLVRRLRGSIHAENRQEGGLALVVELRVV
jgi:C4-dicarboxylate-specific signal transduction histidine kinase